jgi:hypothetical protein
MAKPGIRHPRRGGPGGGPGGALAEVLCLAFNLPRLPFNLNTPLFFLFFNQLSDGCALEALHCHPVSLHVRACALKCQFPFPSVDEIWSLVLYCHCMKYGAHALSYLLFFIHSAECLARRRQSAAASSLSRFFKWPCSLRAQSTTGLKRTPLPTRVSTQHPALWVVTSRLPRAWSWSWQT